VSSASGHDCPGCGRPGINPNRLACPRCWYRLPVSLRGAVVASWRKAAGVGSPAHRRALADALAWYRANPLEVPGV
jgi:hypothetical protein